MSYAEFYILFKGSFGFKPNTRGYNWATLFLGEINTGTWHGRILKFEA
jgi:hypothetical protein